MRKAGPTITSVAAEAGVSVSTVSRVMNGNPTVDPTIAHRVRAVAQRVGYSASPTARSLVLGRTQTIAVVVPDLGNPTFQGHLRGLARAAEDDGYHILIAETAEDASIEVDRARRARARCDAVVMISPRSQDEDLRQLEIDLAPLVIVNRHVEGTLSPAIVPDYRAGMRVLVDHLLGLGHTHLAYLTGREGSYSDSERRAGIAEVLTRRQDVEFSTVSGGVMHEHGMAAVEPVLATGASAVLAFNDLAAMGLVAALTLRGVRVPTDVSVVGFDDIPLAAYTTPSLTTVHVPVAEIGRHTWRRLRETLGTAGGTRVPASADAGQAPFAPTLVERSSTAPPPS